PEKVEWLGELPSLPDLEVRLRESLDEMAERVRIPYEPDGGAYADSLSPDYFNRAIEWLHFAAAKAIATRRVEGYSESVREALGEARRAAYFLGVDGEFSGSESFALLSAKGTLGVVLFELSRAARTIGEPEEAFHNLAKSVSHLTDNLLPLLELERHGSHTKAP